jgi:hypothetical protein
MNTQWHRPFPWRSAIVLCLLCFLCFLPSTVSAQRSGYATIDGVVTEAEGTPVAGAKVMIQTSDGKKPRAVKTDAKGHFAFRSVRHGMYDIRAAVKERSSEWMRNVACKPGTIVTLTLVLPAKSSER